MSTDHFLSKGLNLLGRGAWLCVGRWEAEHTNPYHSGSYFCNQTGRTVLHNTFVITCLSKTEGCFPEVGLAACCCPPLPSSWGMTCSGSFPLLAVPDEEHTGPSTNLLCPMAAWRFSCMHCSIFILPCCCSVVFQAVLCSRCSQSHMCFLAPSNDIFPMKTVASTAFAVLVKKNKSHTLVFFSAFSEIVEVGLFSPFPPLILAPREDASLQPPLRSPCLCPSDSHWALGNEFMKALPTPLAQMNGDTDTQNNYFRLQTAIIFFKTLFFFLSWLFMQPLRGTLLTTIVTSSLFLHFCLMYLWLVLLSKLVPQQLAAFSGAGTESQKMTKQGVPPPHNT